MIKLPEKIKKEYHTFYPNLTNRDVDRIALGFEEFLLLHKGNEEFFEMLSEDVDSLWHFLIVYYPNYLKVYSKILCGRVLGHSPNKVKKGREDVNVKKTLDRYAHKGFSKPRDRKVATPLDIENTNLLGNPVFLSTTVQQEVFCQTVVHESTPHSGSPSWHHNDSSSSTDSSGSSSSSASHSSPSYDSSSSYDSGSSFSDSGSSF